MTKPETKQPEWAMEMAQQYLDSFYDESLRGRELSSHRLRVKWAKLIAQSPAIKELAEAAKNMIPISYNSGPAAPCFDAEDYEVERNRKGWVAIDEKEFKRLQSALKPFKGE